MNLKKYIQIQLKKIGVPDIEINAETNFILEKFFKIDDIYYPLSAENFDLSKLNFIFEKRKNKYPLQYILNKCDFMGKEFFVDENVLIPRPETELLVIEALNIIKKLPLRHSIIDIGTGSGCIPIMIKDNSPNSQITAVDISTYAISVAQKNAMKMKTEIEFIQSDLFSNVKQQYDLIISNPPYIPPQEKIKIQPEVKFEPDIALYTNDNKGVEFYQKIIKNGANFLNDNGYILFELGINQSALVKEFFLQYNYTEIKILKDLDNIDRVISAKVKK